MTSQLRNPLRFFGTLLLLTALPLFAQRNTGGPKTERRPLTEAEINTILRQYGVNPNAQPGPIGCAVLDSDGATVTQVKAMDVGNPGYWLYYTNGSLASEVDFITLPLFTGSPIPVQIQVIDSAGSDDVETPFGIPYWGKNLTSGQWRLVVKNSLGQQASCDFTVVPE
jgi:hypothetical protein